MDKVFLGENSIKLNSEVKNNHISRGLFLSLKLIIFTIVMSGLLFFTFQSMLLKLSSVIILPILLGLDIYKNIKREELILLKVERESSLYTIDVLLKNERITYSYQKINKNEFNTKKGELRIILEDNASLQFTPNYYWDFYHLNKLYEWLGSNHVYKYEK